MTGKMYQVQLTIDEKFLLEEMLMERKLIYEKRCSTYGHLFDEYGYASELIEVDLLFNKLRDAERVEVQYE